MSHSSGSVKVIVYALLANFAIALAKFSGASITQSTALLAEAIHSLVDCANQALLLVGNRASKKAPTERHPLGYGREAFFWSFVVAILLFSMGGLFAIYEGIHKLQSPEPVLSPMIGLGILVFGIVLETGSFLACLKEVRRTNPFPSLWSWFRKTTAAELLVIFTEDLAALLGLTIATACLLLTWITGNSAWDAWGSVWVGSVLIIMAALLAVEIKSLLIGEAPTHDYRPALEEIIQAKIPSSKLLRILALQTGNAEVLLSYKITSGEITLTRDLIAAINEIEREVKLKFPEVRWQFVEPDHEA